MRIQNLSIDILFLLESILFKSYTIFVEAILLSPWYLSMTLLIFQGHSQLCNEQLDSSMILLILSLRVLIQS